MNEKFPECSVDADEILRDLPNELPRDDLKPITVARCATMLDGCTDFRDIHTVMVCARRLLFKFGNEHNRLRNENEVLTDAAARADAMALTRLQELMKARARVEQLEHGFVVTSGLAERDATIEALTKDRDEWKGIAQRNKVAIDNRESDLKCAREELRKWRGEEDALPLGGVDYSAIVKRQDEQGERLGAQKISITAARLERNELKDIAKQHLEKLEALKARLTDHCSHRLTIEARDHEHTKTLERIDVLENQIRTICPRIRGAHDGETIMPGVMLDLMTKVAALEGLEATNPSILGMQNIQESQIADLEAHVEKTDKAIIGLSRRMDNQGDRIGGSRENVEKYLKAVDALTERADCSAVATRQDEQGERVDRQAIRISNIRDIIEKHLEKLEELETGMLAMLSHNEKRDGYFENIADRLEALESARDSGVDVSLKMTRRIKALEKQIAPYVQEFGEHMTGETIMPGVLLDLIKKVAVLEKATDALTEGADLMASHIPSNASERMLAIERHANNPELKERLTALEDKSGAHMRDSVIEFNRCEALEGKVRSMEHRFGAEHKHQVLYDRITELEDKHERHGHNLLSHGGSTEEPQMTGPVY